jgi:hypothetical protein
MLNRRRSRTLDLQVAVLLLLVAEVGRAQNFVKADICDLLKSPEQYSGQLVSVRAEITEVRNVRLADPKHHACGQIPWAFPEDREVKPRPNFAIVQDENYKALMSGMGVLVPKPPRARGTVTATLEGRFDSIYRTRNGRRTKIADGFGHLGLAESRFVLHRVTQVDVKVGPLPDDPRSPTKKP